MWLRRLAGLCALLLLVAMPSGARNPNANCTTFNNSRSFGAHIATHPMGRADIVLGTAADYPPYSHITNGVLGGFDVELTEQVCQAAGLSCTILPMPWHAIWPATYHKLGWDTNSKTYAGEGVLGRWMHCSMGTLNIVARQQSVSFTNPYTDKNKITAGFVTGDGLFPANATGKTVGLLEGYGEAMYFEANNGDGDEAIFNAMNIKHYRTQTLLWHALVASDIDAAYVQGRIGTQFLGTDAGKAYSMLHDSAGWSDGVAYGCHPEYGDLVAQLNRGLVMFKTMHAYTDLCAKYLDVPCDTAGTTYSNTKTAANPEIADHPTSRADIVIATEADFGEFNFIEKGTLGGFDIELTKAVCAEIGKTCAVVPVPWQSVWSGAYEQFGWESNTKTYPGIGHHNRWFHCSSGTHNIVARQQSIAFTDPYTDPDSHQAGFIVDTNKYPNPSSFPQDAAGKAVAIHAGQADAMHFVLQKGKGVFKPSKVVEKDTSDDMFEALIKGDVDAVYTSSTSKMLDEHGGYGMVHGAPGWTRGVGYGCHPEYGDVVGLLNDGLRRYKGTSAYAALCAKFSNVTCDTKRTTFSNVKTTASPEIADHPTSRADIVLATEADWLTYNRINDAVLSGFDIELTAQVCKAAGKTCALVTAPWQSMFPGAYEAFGWPSNSKTYPGQGYQGRWFHCSTGTRNIIARQQSVAFTHPYTDKSVDKAGFVVKSPGGFPPNAAGKRVGLIEGWATSTYFLSQIGGRFSQTVSTVQYSQTALWAALTAGDIDAAYVGEGLANSWASTSSGYQLLHMAAGWSNAVSYGCHPEYGDVVAALNAGLEAFKATSEYASLCARYPDIPCDTRGTKFINTKTAAAPHVADHPKTRADISIVTESDWGQHNSVVNSVVGGFDVALTQAACALAGLTCALTTAPWQSVWSSSYGDFGWDKNAKAYAGLGHMKRWFHCAVGAIHISARQQSIAFTYPYTNYSQLSAGFVTRDPEFPSNAHGKRVGVLSGWAATMHYDAHRGTLFNASKVVTYSSQAELWASLAAPASARTIDAVYTDSVTAEEFLKTAPGQGHKLRHAVEDWAVGVAYGCHPARGDLTDRLNRGLSLFKGTPEYRSLCAQYPAVRCDCNHPYLPANPSDSDVETYILQKYYQPRPRRLDGVTSMSYDERAAMVAAMTTTELFQTSDMHKAYILVSEHNSSGYELTIPTLSGTQATSIYVADFGHNVTHCLVTARNTSDSAFADGLIEPPPVPSGGEHAFHIMVDRLYSDGTIVSNTDFLFHVAVPVYDILEGYLYSCETASGTCNTTTSGSTGNVTVTTNNSTSTNATGLVNHTNFSVRLAHTSTVSGTSRSSSTSSPSPGPIPSPSPSPVVESDDHRYWALLALLGLPVAVVVAVMVVKLLAPKPPKPLEEHKAFMPPQEPLPPPPHAAAKGPAVLAAAPYTYPTVIPSPLTSPDLPGTRSSPPAVTAMPSPAPPPPPAEPPRTYMAPML